MTRPKAGRATEQRRQARGLRRILVWLVPLLAVLVYANTFRAEFTYDDMDVVAKNQMIRSMAGIPRLFTSTYWSGLDSAPDKSLYRPLTMMTYALEYRLHGLKPGWFHVVNVLLHALAATALVVVVRGLLGNDWTALVAGILFAVHPVHTEAVSNVVGRAEILAFLGILAATWAYFRAMGSRGGAVWLWSTVSVAAYLGAMMSKEVGITTPAIVLVTEALLPARRYLLKARGRGIAVFAGYGLAAGVFLVLRGGAVSNRVAHVGLAHATASERILTGIRVLMEYVGLLVAPVRLNADYWIIPLAKSPAEGRLVAALAVLGALAAAAAWCWKRQPAVAWGLSFAALTIFPVSNLAFPIGVMKAERLLYSPSAGFLVAASGGLAWLVARMGGRRNALAGAVVAVTAVTIASSAQTWRRNLVWRDNRALAAATLRSTPDSPSFNVVMGNWFREHKNNAEARKYYTRAVTVLPTDKVSWFNLGNIELDEGNYESAVAFYKRALTLDPNHANAINNLGSAYHKMRRYKDAAEMFLRFKALRPDVPYPYVNLIAVYVDAGDYQAALSTAEEAMHRFPGSADIYYNAAAVYRALGRQEDAQRALARAQALEDSPR